jgi:hypothetical protein|tara:strand:+ start:712 stop:1158 length:447 start_codon:yes stop_codon:yes gene_type:complete
MDNTRHLVVETPDGSIAIAFNEEVPPPEPPPEIIQPRQRFRLLLEYHPVARALAYIFMISSGINLGLFRRTIDIINFALIVSTTGALHSEHSASIGVVVFHGTSAALMIVPFCVLRMWEQAIFQFSSALMCFTAFNTCTQTLEQSTSS